MSDEAELDDSEPTPERQAELRTAYDKNVAEGNAPYEGVELRTRGELSWVMRERGWSGEMLAPGKARADLRGADLWRANLSGAKLVGANLSGVEQEAAILNDANLLRADVSGFEREAVSILVAKEAGANLSGANLSGANLSNAHLYGANLSNASLSGANLSNAYLTGANLTGASLSGANLTGAHLYGANLSGAEFGMANLSDADLRVATLSGASLRRAHMYSDTDLTGAMLDARTLLADIVWNGVPATRLNWDDVDTLGDEWVAHQAKDKEGKPKDKAERLQDFQDAVLANRQVATLLRSQGLNEPADRYAYRAQVLQRQVLRRQRQWLRWAGSGLLDGVAGYGYRPMRSVFTYVLVVVAFAALYFVLGGANGQPLSWNESLVVSLTAFHGRGFFATAFQPGDPQAAVAAIEAVIGLLIEITFIATFTNRFFAR